ncbi:hypothetical protein FVR03_10900 [Pontibacter qinzhouensis]|uniref:Lipoprotein n=1 Tax=Pontibacter qinzhouensis TaxID=2603253 RepID=A0A5C8K8N7_9BACT|nr:hypothetical protein [Pontibacter qinzhouensis]TXK46385.1 hypothetical protein FVR03_10900 [Pontibacter qinzhouensis]
MISFRAACIFLFSLVLSGCADNTFFQEDALVQSGTTPAITPATDSVWVTVGGHYNRNAFYYIFWGKHNRQLWATPVKVPVFRLHKVAGGLKVVKRGGGYQSTSFQLQDGDGRLYAFRTLDKDPVHVLSDFWQKTFVTNVVRDQTSAANPFAALVVPPLAEALRIWHSNPRLYYVSSNDTSFGEFAPLVQGKVFMLEEKFKTPADIPANENNTIGFLDSDEAFRLRFSSNRYHFEQREFAKARLLDLLLGDWDRHKGQWDWAVSKKGEETYFRPIPKDRDQVFLKMNDGLIPFIASSKIMVRKFYSFSEKFGDVQALLINARFIDERLLHELSKEAWLQLAGQAQAALTDQVIAAAVRQLPEPIRKKIGKELEASLQTRRNNLPEAAEIMYSILAKEVTIPGTDQEEQFIVNRHPDGKTQVRIFRRTSIMSPEQQLYNRVFSADETKIIRLYGLAGDDEFVVEGFVNNAIPIEIYGGLGEDKISERSSVKSWKKKTSIFDTERGNSIIFGSEGRDRTTRDVRVHAYDREGN